VHKTLTALCAALPSAQAEAFFARREALTRCIEEGMIEALADDALRALVEQPEHAPTGISPTRWTVATGPGATFAIFRLPREALDNGVYLRGEPSHRIVALACPGSAVLAHYRHETGDGDVFDRNLRLSAPHLHTLRRGQCRELEAWRDVGEWLPTSTTMFACILEARPTRTQVWIYERETGAPRQAVSATFELNRLVYAIELLGEIGSARAAPALACLYDHPAHHIRWAAIRTAIDLDAAVGCALLERATSDPHPHVARAAQAGLLTLAAKES
jgi:hypothetical protein